MLLRAEGAPPGVPEPAGAPSTAAREFHRPFPLFTRAEELKKPHLTLEGTHVLIRYDPRRITTAEAERARGEAERAWGRCAAFFEPMRDLTGWPKGKIPIHLCWDGGPKPAFVRSGTGRVEMRYRDATGYLGYTGERLLTHEIAHVFAGPLSGGGPLDEGLAEAVSAPLLPFPPGQWCGRVLRHAGAWIDPEALFVTGEFNVSDSLTEDLRYPEEAIFCDFLIREFGKKRYATFAVWYRGCRKCAYSNDFLRRNGLESLKPDPAEVRAAFREWLGVPWEEVRRRWEKAMAEDPAPQKGPELLAAGLQLGQASSNLDKLRFSPAPPPPAALREVEQPLARGALALREGRPEAAVAEAARARELLARLRPGK